MRIQNLKLEYIPIFAICSVDLFFSIVTVLGMSFQGSYYSPIYIIYNVAIFFVATILFINDMVIKQEKYTKNQVLMLGIPFVFIFSYLVSMLFENVTQRATTQFLYFFLWGFSGIYLGIYFSEERRFIKSVKLMEIMMVIMSIATTRVLMQVFIQDSRRVGIGGATYQTASYIAAFVFGLNLYFLLFGKYHERYPFFETRLYRFLSIGLLFIQAIATFSSSGRGAAVLIVVYVIFFLIRFKRKFLIKKIFKNFLFIPGAIVISYLVFYFLRDIPIFINSFERAFAFISTEGINWEGTSGRDVIYQETINIIMNSPMIGYGIFGMWNVARHSPHNLFLEVVMQGGIIYLSIVIAILNFAIIKLFKMIKREKEMKIIVVLALYPATMLMFSGSYMIHLLFWFCLSFIMCYRPLSTS